MKGVIFNLLEEVVTHTYGESTWDQLLEAAGLEGVYTSLGNYPDEELLALVGAASSALNLPPNDVIRWFGVEALPLLVRAYPAFFSRHQTTRSFLLTLNGIIHPEVRKLYPGAEPPMFDFDSSSPEVLIMTYRSRRKLCALAEGFSEAAASNYGETLGLTHPLCMHRGDEVCRLELTFTPRNAVS